MKVDRRNFMKTSGMFAAGSMILPPFMQSCQNPGRSAKVRSGKPGQYVTGFPNCWNKHVKKK